MRPAKFQGNIFVANLPQGFTDPQLAELFDAFGIVVGALVARDPVTRKPKNYGLVNLAPNRAAPEAVKAMNGTQVEGRKIQVRLADADMFINIPSARGPSSRMSGGAPHLTSSAPRMSAYAPKPAAPRRPVVVEYRQIRGRA